MLMKLHHTTIDHVIVIGGDGTLHEVMNGLTDFPSTPVGFIPAGTGNDFARGTDMKTKGVERFKEILRQPQFTQVKIGEYHQAAHSKKRVFVNSIGFGLDGEVVRKAAQQSRLIKWSFPYVWALLQSLRTYDFFEAEVIIDQKKLKCRQFTMVTTANHPYYGKGMKIAPQSSIHSPEFSIIIVEAMPKWKILLLFATVFFGKHTGLKEVHEFRGREVRVFPKEIISGQVDGQPIKIEDCTIRKSKQVSSFILKV